MSAMPSFRWAVLSDPGLRRSSNEDCYSTREDIGLYMVGTIEEAVEKAEKMKE